MKIFLPLIFAAALAAADLEKNPPAPQPQPMSDLHIQTVRRIIAETNNLQLQLQALQKEQNDLMRDICGAHKLAMDKCLINTQQWTVTEKVDPPKGK